jgi:5'-nucleotidase
MRILLTNDDGITAPGIEAMFDALVDGAGTLGGPLSFAKNDPAAVTRAPRHVVHTVAPLTVQSATSHGVTFHAPIMVREMEFPTRGGHVLRGTAVDARPADCVKIALTDLWPQAFPDGPRPDLVISGMNAGANCGINTIYSGTVAAALEAAFLGVPSIAVSMLLGKGRPNFAVGAAWARRAIDAVLADGLPRAHECLSINIPATDAPGLTPSSPVPALHVCPINVHGLVDRYERRTSPSGDTYYWASGYGLDFRGTDKGSDVEYLLRGDITITPLTFDLTNHARLAHWREALARQSRRS